MRILRDRMKSCSFSFARFLISIRKDGCHETICSSAISKNSRSRINRWYFGNRNTGNKPSGCLYHIRNKRNLSRFHILHHRHVRFRRHCWMDHREALGQRMSRPARQGCRAFMKAISWINQWDTKFCWFLNEEQRQCSLLLTLLSATHVSVGRAVVVRL